ncbi:hypothetical protein GGX14DRAFT_389729 [Mycena pura]|uniref:Uncharacterized protein n=1 Tax=Mycena pura TaxID=153505 RepID=A0AAD6YJF6_9AGAR|nr:hypothetical protein GGX14DRAFT_389729 [Mycena pura]
MPSAPHLHVQAPKPYLRKRYSKDMKLAAVRQHSTLQSTSAYAYACSCVRLGLCFAITGRGHWAPLWEAGGGMGVGGVVAWRLCCFVLGLLVRCHGANCCRRHEGILPLLRLPLVYTLDGTLFEIYLQYKNPIYELEETWFTVIRVEYRDGREKKMQDIHAMRERETQMLRTQR